MCTLQHDAWTKATNSNNPFTIPTMLAGLGIEKKKYTIISAAIEQEMTTLGMLGRTLDDNSTKVKLQSIFTGVMSQFPEIFNDLPESFKDACLSRIAQNCNHNSKRRKKKEQKHIREPAFGSRSIYFEREGGKEAIMFLPSDVTEVNKPSIDISVDDVSFERLMKVLTEDIAFVATKESIFYKSRGQRTIEIGNERTWRSAMAEMHASGMQRLTFYIQSSWSGVPAPSKPPVGIGQQPLQYHSLQYQDMDTNGEGDSIIPGTPNDNTVPSDNYSGCNTNRLTNHLVGDGVPVNRRVPNRVPKRKAATAAKSATRKSERVKTMLLEHLADTSRV